MYNGVFKDLKTVVHFYNTRGDLGLSVQNEEDLISFLKTFTDKRYESLLH